MHASRVKQIAVFLGTVLTLGGCLTPPPPGPNVTHVVLIWLKHPESAADRAQLIRAAHSLRMIPGVVRVETGRSVPSLGRHVRTDFDLGVVMIFRDQAALARYQGDARHREAAARYLQPLVRHYEIYNLGTR